MKPEQLGIDQEKQHKHVRVLDAAEADATVCHHSDACQRRPSFRVTHGAVARDYCDAHVDQAVAAFPGGPVPYGELPDGF